MIGRVPGFRRREREETSVEDEREALRRQRAAATEELERLKQELKARVAAVREKERLLDEALGRAPGGSPVSAGASPLPPATLPPAALDQREAELARRAAELTSAGARARSPGSPPAAARPARSRRPMSRPGSRSCGRPRRCSRGRRRSWPGRSEAVAARERLVAASRTRARRARGPGGPWPDAHGARRARVAATPAGEQRPLPGERGHPELRRGPRVAPTPRHEAPTGPLTAAAITLRLPRGVSSAGRASALQAEGRRFDPGTLHWPADRESAERILDREDPEGVGFAAAAPTTRQVVSGVVQPGLRAVR